MSEGGVSFAVVFALGWAGARIWCWECIVLMNTLFLAGVAIFFLCVWGVVGCPLLSEGRGRMWLAQGTPHGQPQGSGSDFVSPSPPGRGGLILYPLLWWGNFCGFCAQRLRRAVGGWGRRSFPTGGLGGVLGGGGGRGGGRGVPAPPPPLAGEGSLGERAGTRCGGYGGFFFLFP